MKQLEKDGVIFFGEWVHCGQDPTDKETARHYLLLWKKYLLRKLRLELYDYEPYDGQIVDGDKMKSDPDGWYNHWVEREPWQEGPLAFEGTMCLKFCMKKKLPYQLG